MESFDQTALDSILKKHGNNAGLLIPILRDLQGEYGYLPKEALRHVSEKLNVPLSKVFCVATFYSSFSLEPRGKNLVKVCAGTACHVRHGNDVANKLAKEMKLSGDKKTSPDHLFTLEKVRCMGCCSVAPAVRINEDIYGQVAQDTAKEILKRYRKT
jgi:NADH:ubiquinone oxidoreductase subunit E